jgi:hypothetical protein
MPSNLLNLIISDHAEPQYSSLSFDERRNIDAWLQNLRHWRSLDELRALARRLKTDEEELYSVLAKDLYIVFQIDGDDLIVRAIYDKGAVQAFRQGLERSAT